MPTLSIGMATHCDLDGVFFTIQSLRMHHHLPKQTEFIVVDNYGCITTRDFMTSIGGVYVTFGKNTGTSAPRNQVFNIAKNDIVLCLDCHVLMADGSIDALLRYFDANPDDKSLIQGPMLYDDLKFHYTHFDPIWRDHMWGVWGCDKRGNGTVPFDIPMQGLGLFCCQKSAWLGFNRNFRGFGGEEGYIHEKFRQAGRRCLCLPQLRWLHRFWRPDGVSYPLRIEDRVFNYFVGFIELGLDIAPIIEHFKPYITENKINDILTEALSVKS